MKALLVAAAFGALQAAYLLRLDGHPLHHRPLFPGDLEGLVSLAAVVAAAFAAASASRPWLGALLLGAVAGFGFFELMHFFLPLLSFTRRIPSNLDLLAAAGVVGHFVALVALGWTESWKVRGRRPPPALESRP